MSNLDNLKRKYSWGPVPQWELDKLEDAKPEAPKRRRTRKTQRTEPVGADGDIVRDSDQGA